MKHNPFSFLIVAAGRGRRMGGAFPKPYQKLAGRPVLAHIISACWKAGGNVQIVIHPQDEALYEEVLGDLPREMQPHIFPPVFGGETRQLSVWAGLEALAAQTSPPPHVLIHDGARPFLSPEICRRALEAIENAQAAAPLVPIVDRLLKVNDGQEASERDHLRCVQTPQAFEFQSILKAHRAAIAQNLTDFSDDASLAHWAGLRLQFFKGDPMNMKITHPQDLAQAHTHLLSFLPDIRVGQGVDVHAFGPGDHLWLGGIRMAHPHGLVGHSDADVLLHAMVDAILGGLGEGDIGVHFPPSDPKWKGAASSHFLHHALSLLRKRGGIITHMDATLVCETPKLSLYRAAMREKISHILGIEIERVSIKATTSERLGFMGREEGILALATATLRLP